MQSCPRFISERSPGLNYRFKMSPVLAGERIEVPWVCLRNLSATVTDEPTGLPRWAKIRTQPMTNTFASPVRIVDLEVWNRLGDAVDLRPAQLGPSCRGCRGHTRWQPVMSAFQCHRCGAFESWVPGIAHGRASVSGSRANGMNSVDPSSFVQLFSVVNVTVVWQFADVGDLPRFGTVRQVAVR